MIRVNNAKDLIDALPKPKLEADRHTPSDRGRTGIELEWEVDDPLSAQEHTRHFSPNHIPGRIFGRPH